MANSIGRSQSPSLIWQYEVLAPSHILRLEEAIVIAWSLVAECAIVDQSTISLIDPISQSRLGYPSRSISCRHFQCFDYSTYLATNRNRPHHDYLCPICNKSAPPSKLYCDNLWLLLLDAYPQKTQLTVHRDGRISDAIQAPVDASMLAAASSSSCLVDLTVDSDSDDMSSPLTMKSKAKPTKQEFKQSTESIRMIQGNPQITSMQRLWSQRYRLEDILQALNEQHPQIRFHQSTFAKLAKVDILSALFFVNHATIDEVLELCAVHSTFTISRALWEKVINARPFMCTSFFTLLQDFQIKIKLKQHEAANLSNSINGLLQEEYTSIRRDFDRLMSKAVNEWTSHQLLPHAGYFDEPPDPNSLNQPKEEVEIVFGTRSDLRAKKTLTRKVNNSNNSSNLTAALSKNDTIDTNNNDNNKYNTNSPKDDKINTKTDRIEEYQMAVDENANFDPSSDNLGDSREIPEMTMNAAYEGNLRSESAEKNKAIHVREPEQERNEKTSFGYTTTIPVSSVPREVSLTFTDMTTFAPPPPNNPSVPSVYPMVDRSYVIKTPPTGVSKDLSHGRKRGYSSNELNDDTNYNQLPTSESGISFDRPKLSLSQKIFCSLSQRSCGAGSCESKSKSHSNNIGLSPVGSSTIHAHHSGDAENQIMAKRMRASSIHSASSDSSLSSVRSEHQHTNSHPSSSLSAVQSKVSLLSPQNEHHQQLPQRDFQVVPARVILFMPTVNTAPRLSNSSGMRAQVNMPNESKPIQNTIAKLSFSQLLVNEDIIDLSDEEDNKNDAQSDTVNAAITEISGTKKQHNAKWRRRTKRHQAKQMQRERDNKVANIERKVIQMDNNSNNSNKNKQKSEINNNSSNGNIYSNHNSNNHKNDNINNQLSKHNSNYRLSGDGFITKSNSSTHPSQTNISTAPVPYDVPPLPDATRRLAPTLHSNSTAISQQQLNHNKNGGSHLTLMMDDFATST